ncbi:actin-related protein 9 isoform X8 [Capsicum annuum]|uniref:actin-related protein 9 isoform X8 n=1 Tax=Capsicum annuum TaxID=4072 RepID=UPI001FB0E1E8|nr:actin-related protein 9 isoform X8 [Capsicum annuum]
MDYLKTVIPSNLFAERGTNIVVINPGSANIRIGLAQQDTPFNIPHCISRRTTQLPKRNVQDQMLNSQVTTAQHMERERAYDIIASLLRIPFLGEEIANSSYARKEVVIGATEAQFYQMGRVDTDPPQNNMKEPVFSWADVFEKNVPPPSVTEIKEMLSIVLHDLRFGSAVVHQEGLAAAFGNGLSTACIVNMGAQVTSVICVEDGVALPTTHISLRFGGEDISRCLLWTQRHHQTWPPIRTDALSKPVDLLMLNRLKESYCQIKEGEVEAVAMVHSYEDGMPPGSHKTRLTALNVPPMGLFYPMLLVPDVYPPPPRTWLKDCDDMLEDTWHMDFSGGGAYPMWESYPVYQTKPKKEDDIGLDIGLAEAITKSILATGRIDLQRKLFCSMQLIGGAASVYGLIPAVEERVLHAIPSHEAIDTVEVLQSRTNPAFVSWKGGAILGILDISREAWIHREDWIRNGIHIGSGRKYKDSYYLQAQAMCYMNL